MDQSGIENTSALKKFLRNYTNLPPQEAEQVLSCFHQRSFKRGTEIIKAGSTCNEFYFIISGCVRVYFLTNQGMEKTRHVALENQPISALSSFISQRPSVEALEAVEDTELLYISRTTFFELTKRYSAWLEFYAFFLETAYMGQTKRIEWRITMTAKERFLELAQNNPEYIDRLPNKLLASLLDIAPETLSRLKAAEK